jgi:hypothetical protein
MNRRGGSSLFSDLPALAARPLPAPAADEEAPAADAEEQRPEKRAKLEEQHAGQGAGAGAADAPQQQQPGEGLQAPPAAAPAAPRAALPQTADQVRAALAKIAAHIPNAAKFAKASGLLRQLLDSGAAQPEQHRQQVFDTIRAAFSSPSRCADPALRKEYCRLVQCIERRAEMFRPAERQQLAVYAIYGQLQNELFTVRGPAAVLRRCCCCCLQAS